MRACFGDGFGCYPVAVDLFLDGYSGPPRHTYRFVWKSGWLRVSNVEIETPLATWSGQLIACITDSGETVPPNLAARLFEMPASAPKEVEHTPPDELDEVTDALYWDFIGRCDQLALDRLDTEGVKAEREIAGLEAKFGRALQLAEAKISELRRRMRSAGAGSEGGTMDRSLQQLTELTGKIPEALRRRVQSVRDRLAEVEALVSESLSLDGQVEECLTLYWSTRPRWRGRRLYRIPIPEETYSAGARPRPQGGEIRTEPEDADWTPRRTAEDIRDGTAYAPSEVDDEADSPFDERMFEELLKRDAERELRPAGRLAGPVDDRERDEVPRAGQMPKLDTTSADEVKKKASHENPLPGRDAEPKATEAPEPASDVSNINPDVSRYIHKRGKWAHLPGMAWISGGVTDTSDDDPSE